MSETKDLIIENLINEVQDLKRVVQVLSNKLIELEQEVEVKND